MRHHRFVSKNLCRLFKSAENIQQNVTMLHCAFDCSGIPPANEERLCDVYETYVLCVCVFVWFVCIALQVRNNVAVRMPPHKYCHRHKTKSNVNICTLKSAEKKSSDRLVLQKLEHWRRTLVLLLLILFVLFCWRSVEKDTANLCVVCVYERNSDRYFRSTSCPFATINIFALRICLQFFLYFQWNSTRFCDNWIFVVVSVVLFFAYSPFLFVLRLQNGISPVEIRMFFVCGFSDHT